MLGEDGNGDIFKGRVSLDGSLTFLRRYTRVKKYTLNNDTNIFPAKEKYGIGETIFVFVNI